MKVGTESQVGGTMWKGRRWEWMCSLLQILARSIPKKGFSAPVANLLSYGKNIGSRTGSSKKWLWWYGVGGGRRMQTCVYLRGRKKALKATESAMPGRLEEPEVVQHGWSITSMKSGNNYWKGRSGPWCKYGTARHWTGYMSKTNLLPLRSLQL